MKRKRFVKLVMSVGYDRNTANNAALLARLQRCPYEKRWREYKLSQSVKQAFAMVSNAVVTIGVAAKRLAEDFSAFAKVLERSGNG